MLVKSELILKVQMLSGKFVCFSALHLTIIDRNVEVLKFFLKLLVISANKELLNLTNRNKEGIMHLALQHNHSFVEYLLHFQPDLSLLDISGNTVLHIAIRSHCPSQLLDLLLRYGKKLNLNIDAENYGKWSCYTCFSLCIYY